MEGWEATMTIGDVVWWSMVGLVAGGLAGALLPWRAPGGLLGVVGSGIAGAILGGWGWAQLFGGGPASFLGSVMIGVVGAIGVLCLLRRLHHPTYRV